LKPLFASLALLGLVGCTAHADWVSASLEGQSPYGVVSLGPNIAYLIDVRTETCLLVYANAGAVQVSCAKLKKNVPEAARYITWNAGPEDTSAPAAQPPASPQ
jgi:hypothetical protein